MCALCPSQTPCLYGEDASVSFTFSVQCSFSVFHVRDKTTECGKGVRHCSGLDLGTCKSGVPTPRTLHLEKVPDYECLQVSCVSQHRVLGPRTFLPKPTHQDGLLEQGTMLVPEVRQCEWQQGALPSCLKDDGNFWWVTRPSLQRLGLALENAIK